MIADIQESETIQRATHEMDLRDLSNQIEQLQKQKIEQQVTSGNSGLR